MPRVDPTTPILFINTGKLFGETLRYRDRLQDVLGLGDIRTLGPHPADRQLRDPDGTLWSRDTDACCDFRKVIPIRRALEGFDAQITGRKRFQTHARAQMQAVEYFDGRFRFNPLADWSQPDLETYIARHDLPPHPLVEDGYPSIGCIPCTRRVHTGESTATAAGPASTRTNAASTAWTGRGYNALSVIPGEDRMRSMRSEGRGPRWLDRSRSFHLGSLPLALLSQRLAGNDSGRWRERSLSPCCPDPRPLLHRRLLRMRSWRNW